MRRKVLEALQIQARPLDAPEVGEEAQTPPEVRPESRPDPNPARSGGQSGRAKPSEPRRRDFRGRALPGPGVRGKDGTGGRSTPVVLRHGTTGRELAPCVERGWPVLGWRPWRHGWRFPDPA